MGAALDGDRPRNHRLVDAWSFVHLGSAFALALVMPPFWALAITVLWEPLEVLVLSPIFAGFGVDFGHESLKNALMDLVFNVVGVVLGAYLVAPLVGLEPLL